jgi:hypothetical protein
MHVWAIRVRLQIERRLRHLALFNIALGSKLRPVALPCRRLVSGHATGTAALSVRSIF